MNRIGKKKWYHKQTADQYTKHDAIYITNKIQNELHNIIHKNRFHHQSYQIMITKDSRVRFLKGSPEMGELY